MKSEIFLIGISLLIILTICTPGCLQAESDTFQGLTEDEALLIALNDSLLAEEMNGINPGITDTVLLTGDDGKTIYKFVFYPDSDPGRMGKTITVAVSENGTVIWHDVFGGVMITPVLPGMLDDNRPDDVKEKGALNKSYYPAVSVRDGDLNVKLESVEFNRKYSLYYFVVHAMFIKDAATPEAVKNIPPAPLAIGQVNACGRNPENFTSEFSGRRWDGDAVGFSLKTDPLPADCSGCTIEIDSLFGREGNWSFEVF